MPRFQVADCFVGMVAQAEDNKPPGTRSSGASYGTITGGNECKF